MSEEQHWRKLENLYHGAPCNAYYKPRLAISRGRAELTIPIEPHLFHAAGAVHGCTYFKALDDAAFFAANSLVEDVFVLTAQFNVHLLRPVSAGEMKAVGQVVQATQNFFVAESVVYDSKGREVGKGSGSFVRSRLPLTPEIGYKL